MQGFLISRNELDVGRGTALLVAGAVMMLLTWVLPPVAPIAIAAYGAYQIFKRRHREGWPALLLAGLFWFLRQPFGWILWLAGALMVGFGLFFLIRGLRESPPPDAY